MFKINEYVVYKRDVCKVTGIKHRNFNNKDYYVLSPVDDESLTIEIPIKRKKKFIRPLITNEEVMNIIKEIPNVEAITGKSRTLENEYKKLLNTGDHLDVLTVLKTTYLRNKEREEAGKKTTEKDTEYFELAEKMLYNEFALVLGKTYNETKKFVEKKVYELVQNK